MTTASPVLVATDLSEAARPALMLGRSHAAASNAPLVVCHVVSTVVRNHPLIPTPSENELMLEMNLISAAASSVTQEVDAVLHIPPDAYRVVIASGNADEEIVRTAEAHDASLIVVGAKPRVGAQRWLGHVAERVVRYAATSVLVARRDTPPRKALVVTDYSKGSLPALRFAQRFARRPDVDITLLHVFKPPSSALPS
ncbi:MAG TPA: universal stress protein, partial [Labilithrix sp.]|nr:universal stress protein [Labilithrix sp.]